MSFVFDIPALFFAGVAIFILGHRSERLSKIAIGLVAVMIFISFSTLLYFDWVPCNVPTCDGLTGSKFMFQGKLPVTGWKLPDNIPFTNLPLTKENVPWPYVFMIFLIGYPVTIFIGYFLSFWAIKKYHKKFLQTGPRVGGNLKSLDEVTSYTKDLPPTDYGIGRNPTPEEAVRLALVDLWNSDDVAGKMKEFLTNDDNEIAKNIVVKVNICGGLPNSRGSYTSKEVAAEVVKLIAEAGAKTKDMKISVGDADMVWTTFDYIARAEEDAVWENAEKEEWKNEKNTIDWNKKGWMLWEEVVGNYVEQINPNIDFELVNFSDKSQERFNFGPGANEDLRDEPVSSLLINAHRIISVPVMKTHVFSDITIGMKNMYGTFPERDKAKYHKYYHRPNEKTNGYDNSRGGPIGYEEVIVMMNRAFRPDLTIIDGTVGGEGIGPLSVDPVHFQTVIASENVVMADSIAARLIGFRPEYIDHLRIAHENDNIGKADFAESFVNYHDINGKNTKRKDEIDKESCDKTKDLLAKVRDQYYSHPKDGDWIRPYNKVTDFLDWGNSQIITLRVPLMPDIFSMMSDFLSYDTARIPIIRDVTKVSLRGLNELLGKLDRQFPAVKEETNTRKNVFYVGFFSLMALGYFVLGYLIEGELSLTKFILGRYSTPAYLYIFGVISTILTAGIISTRLKTKNLKMLILSAIVLAFVYEGLSTNIFEGVSAGMWKYTPISNYIFAVFIIPIMLIAFLGFSYITESTIKALKIFELKPPINLDEGSGLKKLINISPVILTLFMFYFLLGADGYYSKIVNPYVILIYFSMAVLGLYYGSKQSLEWNASIMVVGISMGTANELIGALGGFFVYEDVVIPTFHTLSWAINTWAVFGLVYVSSKLIGKPIDMKDSLDKGKRGILLKSCLE
jgi:hypothetical protein